MSATQKRWLTQPNSKLGKVDLTTVLRKEGSWDVLSSETRQELWDLLPKPCPGEGTAHDINVHPLKSKYKQYIEEELRRWQSDLKDGREVKKWREEAMQAGNARANGEWDEWQKQQRNDEWGKKEGSSAAGGVDNSKAELDVEAAE